MAIFRVVMNMVMDGNEQRNTFYVGNPDTTGLDAQDAAFQIADAYATQLAGILSEKWSLYGASIQDMSAAGNPVIPVEIVPFTGDVVTDDWAPLQVTNVVTFRSYTPKPNRGHKHLGGWTELSINKGVFTATVQTAVGNWAGAILEMAEANPAKGLALAHYDDVLHKVTSANPATFYHLNNVPGTLRRRRKGRGI